MLNVIYLFTFYIHVFIVIIILNKCNVNCIQFQKIAARLKCLKVDKISAVRIMTRHYSHVNIFLCLNTSKNNTEISLNKSKKKKKNYIIIDLFLYEQIV